MSESELKGERPQGESFWSSFKQKVVQHPVIMVFLVASTGFGVGSGSVVLIWQFTADSRVSAHQYQAVLNQVTERNGELNQLGSQLRSQEAASNELKLRLNTAEERSDLQRRETDALRGDAATKSALIQNLEDQLATTRTRAKSDIDRLETDHRRVLQDLESRLSAAVRRSESLSAALELEREARSIAEAKLHDTTPPILEVTGLAIPDGVPDDAKVEIFTTRMLGKTELPGSAFSGAPGGEYMQWDCPPVVGPISAAELRRSTGVLGNVQMTGGEVDLRLQVYMPETGKRPTMWANLSGLRPSVARLSATAADRSGEVQRRAMVTDEYGTFYIEYAVR